MNVTDKGAGKSTGKGAVQRHYFVSEYLDELAEIEKELAQQGLTEPQIHVLSLDDTGTETQQLHGVTSFMKSNVVKSGEIGAAIGSLGAVAVLLLAWLLGLTDSVVGWIPYIFLAIVVFGFCTWEGGFIGIQRKNQRFERFQQVLSEGRHILFVDVMPAQEAILIQVMDRYPHIEPAGTDRGTPAWIMKGQKAVPRFLTETMP